MCRAGLCWISLFILGCNAQKLAEAPAKGEVTEDEISIVSLTSNGTAISSSGRITGTADESLSLTIIVESTGREIVPGHYSPAQAKLFSENQDDVANGRKCVFMCVFAAASNDAAGEKSVGLISLRVERDGEDLKCSGTGKFPSQAGTYELRFLVSDYPDSPDGTTNRRIEFEPATMIRSVTVDVSASAA